MIRTKGKTWFTDRFLPRLSPVQIVILSLAIGAMFASQVEVIVGLTPRYLPTQPSHEPIEVDVGGTVLSILGIVVIIGVSLLAGHYGWIRPLRSLEINGILIQPLGLSPAVWCIGFGIAVLVAFVHWELYQERLAQPTLVPPALARKVQ